MSKQIKALIAVGGTGGHVFPGCSLANHLIDKDYKVSLITDKRGIKYLEKFDNLKFSILPSTTFVSRNLFTLSYSLILIFYSIIRSLFFLIFNRPNIIFGMGGYASFPICIAATILRIKFVIYENNLIIGKANRYLLPFTKKILVSYKDLESIPKNYINKVNEVGNIIRKEIINYNNVNSNNLDLKTISILILGGSQAAKIFAETLPNIFLSCFNHGVKLKIYQHCLPSQNEKLKLFYKNNNIEVEIFNFTNDLIKYFSKVNLAITRSGSSMLAELTNAKIPFISIPLPTSADNHQLKNAIFYQKKNFGFLIEEKDLNNKLLYLIKDIYKNSTILEKIKQNQSQYSDKYVYNNIDQTLKKILDEKN